MTPALPLPAHDGENTQVILDLIAKSAIDTGGRAIKLRWGTGSATFTAANSALATVTHGMGSTPVAIFVMPAFAGGITPYVGAVDTATVPTSTQFVARLNTNPSSTAVTATVSFYWAAIG